MTYHLNEYELNRKYGGPEEGGWWFDTGEFVRCHGTFETMEQAEVGESELESYLRDLRVGRYRPGSVLGNGWPELWIEEEPGACFPTETPFYE